VGAAHWGEAYYGDLYLASVEDLLGPRLSALEAQVVAGLLALRPHQRVLDLACGHGRHARVLSGRARVVGLDRSRPYLDRARRDAPAAALVRGDVRALPFAAGAFEAAFSWYASLFMFDDAVNAACLAEAARVVRAGGRLLVHHANPLRLALAPREETRRVLGDGSSVEERSSFDAAAGVDRCARRLFRPGGAVLAATAELRYYSPSEWGPLAARAGLRLVELTSTTDAGRAPRRAPGPEAPDLIAVLEKT
jgi:SAM-dependent methyltransferase